MSGISSTPIQRFSAGSVSTRGRVRSDRGRGRPRGSGVSNIHSSNDSFDMNSSSTPRPRGRPSERSTSSVRSSNARNNLSFDTNRSSRHRDRSVKRRSRSSSFDRHGYGKRRKYSTDSDRSRRRDRSYGRKKYRSRRDYSESSVSSDDEYRRHKGRRYDPSSTSDSDTGHYYRRAHRHSRHSSRSRIEIPARSRFSTPLPEKRVATPAKVVPGKRGRAKSVFLDSVNRASETPAKRGRAKSVSFAEPPSFSSKYTYLIYIDFMHASHSHIQIASVLIPLFLFSKMNRPLHVAITTSMRRTNQVCHGPRRSRIFICPDCQD